MTLKHCRVTQLDDTFWRVDFDDTIVIQGRHVHSPQVVKHVGERWFFQGRGDPFPEANSLDELLRLHRLTTEEPKPETAEDRLRREITAPCGTGFWFDDVKEILAELDRLRADCARLDQRNDEHVREIVELRCRPSVDVDAVLAPVRRVLAHCESRVSFHDKERDAMVLRGLFGDAHWHDAGHSQASTIANKLSVAIAEAEKIGRM